MEKQKNIIDQLGAPYRYINEDVDYEWYNNYLKNRATNVRCSIVEKSSNIILGLVSLTNINTINQSAVLHIMIGDENQGKGAGTFAVKEMINHAFNNLNIHRIEVSVLATNERAIHLYEKCGFKKEGTKKDAVYKNGKFVDMCIYGIIRDIIYK